MLNPLPQHERVKAVFEHAESATSEEDDDTDEDVFVAEDDGFEFVTGLVVVVNFLVLVVARL